VRVTHEVRIINESDYFSIILSLLDSSVSYVIHTKVSRPLRYYVAFLA